MENQDRLGHQVCLLGWRADRNQDPVGLVRVFKAHLKLPLFEAKQLLDQFAERGTVSVTLATPADAQELRAVLEELGVLVDSHP